MTGYTANSRRLLSSRMLTLDHLCTMLRQYTVSTGHSVDLLLIGGLAMLAYGHPSRATIGVDGELCDHVRSLAEFLSRHHIPSNLGQSVSGWSVVAMPPGYRNRATVLIDEPGVRISLLAPVDFIIAKLRRGTDADLTDAAWIAARFHISANQVRASADAALAASLEDTALFLFQHTVDRFCATVDSAD